MHGDGFQDWRRECDAVEQEMERLLRERSQASPEERQIRQIQFAALVERRNAAMRHLLHSAPASPRSVTGVPPISRLTLQTGAGQSKDSAAGQSSEAMNEHGEAPAIPRTPGVVQNEGITDPRPEATAHGKDLDVTPVQGAHGMNEPDEKSAARRIDDSVQVQDMDNLDIRPAAPLVASGAEHQGSNLAPSAAEGVEQQQFESGGRAGLNDGDLKALSDFFHDDFDFDALKKAAPQTPAMRPHPLGLSGRFLPLWRVNVQVQLATPKSHAKREADR